MPDAAEAGDVDGVVDNLLGFLCMRFDYVQRRLIARFLAAFRITDQAPYVVGVLLGADERIVKTQGVRTIKASAVRAATS